MQTHRFHLAIAGRECPLLVRAAHLQHCLDGSIELLDERGRVICYLPPKSVIAHSVAQA